MGGGVCRLRSARRRWRAAVRCVWTWGARLQSTGVLAVHTWCTARCTRTQALGCGRRREPRRRTVAPHCLAAARVYWKPSAQRALGGLNSAPRERRANPCLQSVRFAHGLLATGPASCERNLCLQLHQSERSCGSAVASCRRSRPSSGSSHASNGPLTAALEPCNRAEQPASARLGPQRPAGAMAAAGLAWRSPALDLSRRGRPSLLWALFIVVATVTAVHMLPSVRRGASKAAVNTGIRFRARAGACAWITDLQGSRQCRSPSRRRIVCARYIRGHRIEASSRIHCPAAASNSLKTRIELHTPHLHAGLPLTPPRHARRTTRGVFWLQSLA